MYFIISFPYLRENIFYRSPGRAFIITCSNITAKCAHLMKLMLIYIY